MSLAALARRAVLAIAFTPAAVALANPPAVVVPPPTPAAPLEPIAPPVPPAPAVDCSPANPVPCPPLACPPKPVAPAARPLACEPKARLIVVKVPPPEVVVRPVGCKTGCAAPALTGTPAPTGAPAMTTVYQTYTYPYLTYTWVPVAQQPLGLAGGQPFGVAPAGGMLAGSGLVAPQTTGLTGAGELELLLARMLVSRFVQPATECRPQPAADPCDAKLRQLQQQIADLDKRIEALRADTREATLLNTRAIVDLQGEVDQLLDAIGKLGPGDSQEKVIGDLQQAVKKIQSGRKR